MATIIDLALAKHLVHEYEHQNSSAGGPGLLTPDGQFLKGYFLDRESLEALLSNPKVAGISLLFAKDLNFVGQPENVFTLIFAGAEPNNESSAKAPYKNIGDIYCAPPPCPPICMKLG